MSHEYPINPGSAIGFAAALALRCGVDPVPFPLAPPEALTLSGGNFSVTERKVDLTTAITLGLGPIGHATGKLESYVYVSDFAIFQECPFERPKNFPMVSVVWGVGYRVVLEVHRKEGEVKVGFNGLAAAAELGLAEVTINIAGLGLGAEAARAVPESLIGFKKFGFEEYKQLETARKTMADHAVANIAKLRPVPIRAVLDRRLGDIQLRDAAAVCFAMWRIKKGASLAEALSDGAKLTLPPIPIREAYAHICQTEEMAHSPTHDSKTITSTQRRAADRWLQQNG